MKNISLTLLIFSAFFLPTFSQTPYWKWAKHTGGIGYDEAGALLMNNDSNLIVTGFFQGTGWFPSDTLTAGGSFAMFIAEYTRSGEMLWVKHVADASGGIEPHQIFQDASGNYYITGTFGAYSWGGAVTFFPATAFTSLGNKDIFIAKFNPAGTLLWAQAIQSTEEPNTTFVADMDTNGKMWIAGRMFDRTIFTNPVNDTLYEDSKYHIFLSCYNASGLLTANSKVITNNSATDPQGIEAGVNDDVFLAGYYYNRQLFGIEPDTFSIPGPGFYPDIFTAKFSAGGVHPEWAVGSGGEFSSDMVTSLDRTTEGKLILTGEYTLGPVAINSTTPAPISLTTSSAIEIFIAQYDTLGIAHWAKNAGHSSTSSGIVVNDACIGNDNKIYLTGNYTGTATFGESPSVINISDMDELFVAEYAADGAIQWAQHGGSGYGENSYSVANDDYGFAYIAGTFTSAAVFDSTSTLDITLYSYGYSDILVAKVGAGDDGTVGDKELKMDNGQWLIYPNPANNKFHIQSKVSSHKCTVTLINSFGQVVFKISSIDNQKTDIDVSALCSGIYSVFIQDGNNYFTSKIVISH